MAGSRCGSVWVPLPQAAAIDAARRQAAMRMVNRHDRYSRRSILRSGTSHISAFDM